MGPTWTGMSVPNSSFYGLANGTARAVPSSGIAACKVCHIEFRCQEQDILAAFDDAIADGVDIITASIGLDIAVDLSVDSLAIGVFHSGVLTVNSAGNNNFKGSVSSAAPWMLTLAASTIDRWFIDKVKGKILLCNDGDGMDEATTTGALGCIVPYRPTDENFPLVPLPRINGFEVFYPFLCFYASELHQLVSELALGS
ncbi:subtilase family protein [Actinidia rufa]|uniref:Subtilase family protein n=1 Tax=Actinidia rufa TaxID=165716 RepID=A0A7J0DTJ2_9ERIC|nr:subtilase family protein [Actinidia rufa]